MPMTDSGTRPVAGVPTADAGNQTGENAISGLTLALIELCGSPDESRGFDPYNSVQRLTPHTPWQTERDRR